MYTYRGGDANNRMTYTGTLVACLRMMRRLGRRLGVYGMIYRRDGSAITEPLPHNLP